MGGNKSRADNFLRQLVRVPSLLGGVMILINALIIMYDVVARSFGGSTYWAGEVTVYFLVMMTFLGGGFALQSGKHVQVTFILTKLSASTSKILEKLTKTLILFISLGLLYFGTITVLNLHTSNFVSATMLAMPLAIPYAAIPVGALFLIIEVIRELFIHHGNDGGTLQ